MASDLRAVTVALNDMPRCCPHCGEPVERWPLIPVRGIVAATCPKCYMPVAQVAGIPA